MILLDTCTLLWLAMDRASLSPRAEQALDAPGSIVFVSVVSAFEIGQKHAKGKLELPMPPQDWVERALVSHRLRILPLDLPSATGAAALPLIHNDPFDRLLIATACHHKLTLLTPDPKIHAYPDTQTLW